MIYLGYIIGAILIVLIVIKLVPVLLKLVIAILAIVALVMAIYALWQHITQKGHPHDENNWNDEDRIIDVDYTEEDEDHD